MLSRHDYLDLLALLAREAAPVEFERPLIAARQAGAPPPISLGWRHAPPWSPSTSAG